MDARVEASIGKEGGLSNIEWYLNWHPTDSYATLDGRFTAAQLRDIANHMEVNEARDTRKISD